MKAVFGIHDDIASWMALVDRVSWNFPGLESEEALLEHQRTVLRFMGKQQALCVKEAGAIIGVLLFSRKRNMICCLAVAPEHRRKGVASLLLAEGLRYLDRTKAISVSTFLESDPKGCAPRALYQKFGFVAGAFSEEFGSPVQQFVLPPNKR